ncbi:hypothetical protein EVAR_20163_1 [Eumeta japonica]|uniref:Uncharacterized protein n=1 Tax=Eumeta variegata TaxID=151549 RepID=A0A4C1UVL1_EUMVA|nr:hypothetical protein EVAR_20163_1 [Eumeta japonica]
MDVEGVWFQQDDAIAHTLRIPMYLARTLPWRSDVLKGAIERASYQRIGVHRRPWIFATPEEFPVRVWPLGCNSKTCTKVHAGFKQEEIEFISTMDELDHSVPRRVCQAIAFRIYHDIGDNGPTTYPSKNTRRTTPLGYECEMCHLIKNCGRPHYRQISFAPHACLTSADSDKQRYKLMNAVLAHAPMYLWLAPSTWCGLVIQRITGTRMHTSKTYETLPVGIGCE